VGDAATFSPRLGASFDLTGASRWIVNFGYAHYVGMFVTQVADAACRRPPGIHSFFYAGPDVNTGATGPYLTAAVSSRFCSIGSTPTAVPAVPRAAGPLSPV
jgi:hypothetical protein